MGVAAQRVGKSGGRLEGIDKGGRAWFRERVQAAEKRVSSCLSSVLLVCDVVRSEGTRVVALATELRR
jgi:hypothetical protein